jgi:uncharacterized protein YceK
MALRTICVALLFSTLPIAGCGTVSNLVVAPPEAGGMTPFGGVRQDLAGLQKARSGEIIVGADGNAKQGQPQLAHAAFYAADLPFSFVGDIVMWPYTAAYAYINSPVPVPPITEAPMMNRPQTAPVEILPEPKKLPSMKTP